MHVMDGGSAQHRLPKAAAVWINAKLGIGTPWRDAMRQESLTECEKTTL